MRKFWIAIPVFIAEAAVGCPGPPGPIPPTRMPVFMLIICVFGLLLLMHHHRAEAHTFIYGGAAQ